MSTKRNIENEFITLDKEDLKIKRFFFNAIKDSKQLVNFNNDRNKIHHILRGISFLDGNSKNYIEYDKNLSLLKGIQHYNLSDFVNQLEMDQTYQDLFFMENEDVIFIRNDGSEYGSNNRILDLIISKNISLKNKVCDYSKKSVLNSNSHIVYIDDFVGTGRTAIDLLDGDYLKKTIVAYYILESTIEKLENEGYNVIYFNKASIVKDEVFKYYKDINSEPYNLYEEYNLNTMISESYNSPNNNFPWLFYFKNDSWRNFLDVRNNERFLRGRGNQIIKQQNEEKYLNQIYNNICETRLREKLSSLGYETKNKRKNLFYTVIEQYEFDVEYTSDHSKASMAKFIIYIEIKKIFNSFQENIVISNN
ncbi:MAG TPA: hypothetical protein GXZ95_00195 [Mollicutes bacterium]|nr:hypothetical protein [Mollicutes bacterium]